MSSVLIPRKVNVEKVELGNELKPMSNVSGLYSIPFKYNGSKILEIQTPKMKAPFGASEGMNNNGKYSLDLSFEGEGTDTKEGIRMNDLRKVISELDHLLSKKCFENPEWLKIKNNKGKTVETYMEDYLSSSIKPPKDEDREKYSDRFKISIPCKDGRAYDFIRFFDMNVSGKEINWDEFLTMKGFYARCIFKISGAWVSPSLKKFGYFVKLERLQYSPGEGLSGTSFQTYDSDSESENEGDEIEDEIDDSIVSDIDDE